MNMKAARVSAMKYQILNLMELCRHLESQSKTENIRHHDGGQQ